MENEERRIRE
jgi:tousled-like kinase